MPNIIEARNLSKHYTARVKAEGLAAGFHGLLRPEYRRVEAVRGIDLTVSAGEMVAFIGPNGAGKSTTIKMMTGILQPSGGELAVAGLDPARDRSALSRRVGTVFGQKSQLWFHLPPSDSFALLGAIYDIERAELKRRVEELAALFELEPLMKTPVRKLSLGQRIRCEVAASLLHRPDVLFLDEPTIGLDVIVKQAIRALIRRMNAEQGTTVFLTSHDAGDVEQLCRRAVVINDGQIVLDQPVDAMKREYLGRKVIDVRFTEACALPELGGVTVLSNRMGGCKEGGGEINGSEACGAEGENTAQLAVDTALRPIGEVMQALTGPGLVADITVSDPPMEEIIAAIFRKKQGDPGLASPRTGGEVG